MNGFIIICGIYKDDLYEKVMEVVKLVGKVYVNFGNIVCKVLDVIFYIEKVWNCMK